MQTSQWRCKQKLCGIFTFGDVCAFEGKTSDSCLPFRGVALTASNRDRRVQCMQRNSCLCRVWDGDFTFAFVFKPWIYPNQSITTANMHVYHYYSEYAQLIFQSNAFFIDWLYPIDILHSILSRWLHIISKKIFIFFQIQREKEEKPQMIHFEIISHLFISFSCFILNKLRYI